MKIEVWSDVVCPFCYIGKKRLERALKETHPNWSGEIEWKSFQLDPNADQFTGEPLNEYLAKSKGISLEEAQNMTSYVVEKGTEENIQFEFDKAIVANTKKAHLLLHAAKPLGLQTALKERFMRAYFTEGRDMNSDTVLTELATELGMKSETIIEALQSDELGLEFSRDLQEARQIGISGVPFFVFNRKFAISGAQPMEVFTGALEKAWDEAPELDVLHGGEVCDTDSKNC